MSKRIHLSEKKWIEPVRNNYVRCKCAHRHQPWRVFPFVACNSNLKFLNFRKEKSNRRGEAVLTSKVDFGSVLELNLKCSERRTRDGDAASIVSFPIAGSRNDQSQASADSSSASTVAYLFHIKRRHYLLLDVPLRDSVVE